MTEESITKKLSELFELHKSGAITKEEFENLKKQALSEDGVPNAENGKTHELRDTKLPGNPSQDKKGSRIWIFAVIGIALLVVAFLLLKNKNGDVPKGQDGGNYKTVKIGNQVWMAENLNVSTFRNGDPIPEAKTDEEWLKSGQEQKPVWCYYNNDPTNDEKYGKLYNWYAVNDPRLIAPKGWHIPSDAEWTSLTDNLGKNAGSLMKSTSGWSESGNGTNTSGFNGLPGGDRTSLGTYDGVGSYGYWWSSMEVSSTYVWGRFVYYGNAYVYRDYSNKQDGFSVRCIRDL
jgi:uncharacterized protein (TIGR02145 family)